MNDPAESIPRPRNPYLAGMWILLFLVFVGVILIGQSGIGSVGRPNIGMLLTGILLTTVAGIFLFGVVFGWRGFEKRFGSGLLLGYWEIEGKEWSEHLETEKRGLRKLALIGGVGMPGLVLVVMLVLAHSDGDLEGIMPIACIASVGFAIVMLAVVLLRWFSLTGNQGCVWLAERGVLINRMAFFIDGFGMQTLSSELLNEEGKHTLVISYQVQVRRGTVDKELLVPVPEEQVSLVREAMQEWERCLR